MIKLALFLFLVLVTQIVFADGVCPKGQKIINHEARYAEAVRMQQSYESAGMGIEASRLRLEAASIEKAILYAYLNQEMSFFPVSKQPNCMFSVLSKITGAKIAAQPRPDGKWNVYVNDLKTREGLNDNELLIMVERATK